MIIEDDGPGPSYNTESAPGNIRPCFFKSKARAERSDSLNSISLSLYLSSSISCRLAKSRVTRMW